MAALKTVKDWEKKLEVKLDYDIMQGKVHRLQ